MKNQESIEIIYKEAFDFLAKKHQVSASEIMLSFLSGAEAVQKQVNQLVASFAAKMNLSPEFFE